MRQINKLLILSLLLVMLMGGCSYLRPEPEVKIETKTEKIKVAVVDKDKVWTKSKRAQRRESWLRYNRRKTRN